MDAVVVNGDLTNLVRVGAPSIHDGDQARESHLPGTMKA